MRQMKVICNKLIPIKGFSCMNLFGVIYRRQEYCGWQLSQRTLNHELIHTLQSEDFIPNKKNNNFIRILDYLIFYLLYIIEYILKLICTIFYWKIRPYRSISYEQIAYLYENDFTYQENRKRCDWVPYMFKFVCK